VLSSQLQAITETGAARADQQKYAQVSQEMQKIANIGEAAVRAIAKTDFSVPEPEALDLRSDRAFELACEFVQRQGDSSFSLADLRDHLVQSGASDTAAAKQAGKAFERWRGRMLEIADDQGARAMWAGPDLLGRGRYALATTGKLDLLKPFAHEESSTTFKPIVRLGKPDPDIWADPADINASTAASKPAKDSDARTATEKPSKQPTELELTHADSVLRALSTVQDISVRISSKRIAEIINDNGWAEVTTRQSSRAIRLLQRHGLLNQTPKRAKRLEVNFTTKDIRESAKTTQGRSELIGTVAADGAVPTS
jgi:hypothetical protein